MRLSKQILPQVFSDICKTVPCLTIPDTMMPQYSATAVHTGGAQFLLNWNMRTAKKSCRLIYDTASFLFLLKYLARETKLPKVWEDLLICYYQVDFIYFIYTIIMKTLLHITKSHPFSSGISAVKLQDWVESDLNLLRLRLILE